MAQASDSTWDQFGRPYGQIMARAWTDPSFKERLLSDPPTVLSEYGVNIPPGLEIVAVENTPDRVYIIIPPPPVEDISDEDLVAVAGGGSTVGCAGTAGSISTFSCPAGSMSTWLCAGTAGTL
jgi:hypothetical protein